MTQQDPILVYFIGAGPGNPDLLSIKGKEILSQAEVVLYDFLAHPGCLAHTTATCRLICVGKRKGQHGKTQQQINALMLKHAKAGARVVRLKGGDPMVFGRMTEEMDTLLNACIAYGIVPGISTIQGAACNTGIPLTHRAKARSFAILTGTTWKRETLSDREIPDADTLLIFMPSTHIQALIEVIVKKTRHTWDSHVAIVVSASTAAQTVTCTNLKEIYQNGLQSEPKHPVMLIIGDTVAMYEQYQWRHLLPLRKWRLWITAETLPKTNTLILLKKMGLELCHLPLVTTTPLTLGKRWTQNHLEKAQLLLFCSPRAVTRFFEVLAEQKIDIRRVSAKITAVGQQTAETLRQYGLGTDIVPKANFGASGLLAELPSDMAHTQVHVYGAKELATDLLFQLKQRHARVYHHALYRTRSRKEVPILDVLGQQDILFFSSPSQVASFMQHYDDQGHNAQILSLGKTTYTHCVNAFKNTPVVHQSPVATYEAAFQYIFEIISNIGNDCLRQGGSNGIQRADDLSIPIPLSLGSDY